MACDTAADACRSRHVAAKFPDAEFDGVDFEALCPVCGHRGFRVSHAKVRAYRNVWTCARCKASASDLRCALLRLDIPAACLGIYDGPVQKTIDPDAARRMDLAARDILATPRLKPADIRIVLAEAQGHKVPGEFRPFVRWAMGLGIGKTQAQEAAARWCRPAGQSPPLPGAGGRDKS